MTVANMRRFNDPTDSVTQLMVFGRVGANKAGRITEGQALLGKVNENYHILTFQIVSSNGLRQVILSFEKEDSEHRRASEVRNDSEP